MPSCISLNTALLARSCRYPNKADQISKPSKPNTIPEMPSVMTPKKTKATRVSHGIRFLKKGSRWRC